MANQPATGRAGVAPSREPDAERCAVCGGTFVPHTGCSTCRLRDLEAIKAEPWYEPEGEAAALAEGVPDALAALSRGLQAVVERRMG